MIIISEGTVRLMFYHSSTIPFSMKKVIVGSGYLVLSEFYIVNHVSTKFRLFFVSTGRALAQSPKAASVVYTLNRFHRLLVSALSAQENGLIIVRP